MPRPSSREAIIARPWDLTQKSGPVSARAGIYPRRAMDAILPL